MASEIFAVGFIENLKVLFVGIMIWAITFSLLVRSEILGGHHNMKINNLVALLAAVIVSFSGVVTYAISYAINWFIIIIFIVFLMLTLLYFLGVKPGDVASQATKNGKTIVIVFGVLFLIILVKGFFALNNTFDTNNPPSDQYSIDTSFNTGVDDITNSQINPSFWDRFFNVDSDLVAAALFLLVIGVFVMFIS